MSVSSTDSLDRDVLRPEADASAGPLHPAGFWLRAAAALIDGLIMSLLLVPAIALIAYAFEFEREAYGAGDIVYFAVLFLLPWLYFAGMESGPRQASWGKRVLGLMVTDRNGRRIRFGRATARHFAKLASAMPFLLGFVLAAFTSRKRALHDIISGCLVIEQAGARRHFLEETDTWKNSPS